MCPDTGAVTVQWLRLVRAVCSAASELRIAACASSIWLLACSISISDTASASMAFFMAAYCLDEYSYWALAVASDDAAWFTASRYLVDSIVNRTVPLGT